MNDRDRPQVSIVTPSLNQGRFIEETILSVKNQRGVRVEHIVIDGGSTDDTLEILHRHPHVSWVSAPDAGQSDAINKGFRRASGDIVAWLNADDTYLPGALSDVVEFLQIHQDVDAVYGDCEEVDERGQRIRTIRGAPFDMRQLLLLDIEIAQPATFFRRRILDRVGGVDPRFHLAMDFDYFVRIARAGRLEYRDRTWATFRVHPVAKTSSRTREILAEHLTTLDAVFADPDLPRSVGAIRRRAYSNVYLSGAVRSYQAGMMAEARSRLVAAVRAYPNPLRPKTVKALLLLLDATFGVRLGARVVELLRRIKPRA